MQKKKSVSIVLIFFLAVYAAAESIESNEKKLKPVSITMFIPGINQLKSRQIVKGSLLLGAFIGTAAGALIYNKKGSDWYDRYVKSTNAQEIITLRQKAEKSFKKRNLFIAGIFSVWIVHVVDLTFFKSKKVGVKGEAGTNNLNIGLYYRF